MTRKNNNQNTIPVNISKDQIIKLLNGEIGKISKQIKGICNMIKSADARDSVADLSSRVDALTAEINRLELDKLVRSETGKVLGDLKLFNTDIDKSIRAFTLEMADQGKRLTSAESKIASLADTGKALNNICTASISGIDSSVSEINSTLVKLTARADADKQEYEKRLSESEKAKSSMGEMYKEKIEEYEKRLSESEKAKSSVEEMHKEKIEEYEKRLTESEEAKSSMEEMYKEKIEKYKKAVNEKEERISELHKNAEALQSRLDSYEEHAYRKKYKEIVEHKKNNNFTDINTNSYEGFITCCSDGDVIKRLFNDAKDMIKQNKPEKEVLLYNELIMFCIELYNTNNASNPLMRHEQEENTEYNRSYNEKMHNTDSKIVSAILLRGIVDRNNLVFGDCKSLVEVK